MRPNLSNTTAAVTAFGIAACLTATAAPASAVALVTRDTVTTTASESGLLDDCRPGITGTIVGTDVFTFQTVEAADGLHFVGTDSGTGRIDWSDGTYTIIGFTDHLSFSAVGTGTTVFTNAHEDSGYTYTADGAFMYRGTFHVVERMTVTGGVVRVEFERGHFHFFGAAPATCPSGRSSRPV
jgi:hypothetical protein